MNNLDGHLSGVRTTSSEWHLGHDNPRWPYHIGHDLLEAVSDEKDLGVTVDDKLKFHSQTLAQVAKANQAQGLIKRTFTTRKPCVVKKLYRAIVCPHLKFEMTLTSSDYKMDIKALESVQRWATKLIPALHDKPYEEHLVSLKLPTPVYKRKRGDAIATSKLLENDLSSQVFSSSLASTTRGDTKKLHFFPLHAVPPWNSFSEATIKFKTIDAFKKVQNHRYIQESSWSELGQCRV